MTGRAALFRWLVACHAFFVSADRVPDRVQFQRFPLRHRLVRILLVLVLRPCQESTTPSKRLFGLIV